MKPTRPGHLFRQVATISPHHFYPLMILPDVSRKGESFLNPEWRFFPIGRSLFLDALTHLLTPLSKDPPNKKGKD